jgi:hypothetical protein
MIQSYRVHTGPVNAEAVAQAFATVPGVVKTYAGTEHVYIDVDDDVLLGSEIERTVKAHEPAKAAHGYCGFNSIFPRWLW